jgi:hypothetical protein
MPSRWWRDEGEWRLEEVLAVAARADVAPVFAVGRCSHGKKRQELCASCEYGYATDGHTFAVLRGPVARDSSGKGVAAVSDDMEWIGYIPARFQSKIDSYT